MSRKFSKIFPEIFFHKTLQYGHRWIPLDPRNQNGTFWADLGHQGHWGPRGYAEVTLSFLFQTPKIWVSTDSPGPQQPRFDILSWLRTTWTLRTPRVCGGHFAFFVPNPYNMGVYGLPRTPATKIWHFELTQDLLDTEATEGIRRSLCLFCSKPLQYTQSISERIALKLD